MIDVLKAPQRSPTFGQRLAQGIGRGLDFGRQIYAENQRNEAIRNMFGEEVSKLPPEMQQEYIQAQLKGQIEQQKQFAKYQNQRQMMQDLGIDLEGNQTNQKPPQATSEGFNEPSKPKLIPQDRINKMMLVNPNLAKNWQQRNDQILSQQRHEEEQANKKFESERKYHTQFSKDSQSQAENLRSSLPKKESALNFARNAIESGDVSFFSPAKLAEATGIDLFTTAKGAQLITAGKENLLSNMSRVSAKGQNIWFEQRLNSMFPKIGQSEEANLTVQEMLEGEAALDKAWLQEYDRIVEDDEKNFGYERKDSSKRAYQSIKPLEQHIMRRTTFRMKEIEEQEEGLKALEKKVGKNVTKGTPLTLAMAKLYFEKFGDKGLNVAEKNGYYIPKIEEYESFQKRPEQFREEF